MKRAKTLRKPIFSSCSLGTEIPFPILPHSFHSIGEKCIIPEAAAAGSLVLPVYPVPATYLPYTLINKDFYGILLETRSVHRAL